MSAPFRVPLLTIAARQLWDGRKAVRGHGFIPGIRHFQAGVRALRRRERAGDAGAAERLGTVEAGLEAVEAALARWSKGQGRFMLESLGVRGVEEEPRQWHGALHSVRVRAPETRRLALLIVQYDAACAVTVRVTAAAREAGLFNAHHACIAECAREIRAAVAAGYAGKGHGRGRRRKVLTET